MVALQLTAASNEAAPPFPATVESNTETVLTAHEGLSNTGPESAVAEQENDFSEKTWVCFQPHANGVSWSAIIKVPVYTG